MNKLNKKSVPMYVAIGIIVLIEAIYLIRDASAHYTPCEGYEDNTNCHYVQVVNPITGKLETQYVCD